MKNNNIILITGITGQDGIILSSLLVKKKYEVIGFASKKIKKKTKNITYLNVDLKKKTANKKNFKYICALTFNTFWLKQSVIWQQRKIFL